MSDILAFETTFFFVLFVVFIYLLIHMCVVISSQLLDKIPQ